MSGFLAFKIYENAKKPPWNCLLYRPGSQGIVGSTEQARGGLWERVQSASGEWRKGNHFVWKAKWALRERASGEQNREGLSSHLRTPIWMKYQSELDQKLSKTKRSSLKLISFPDVPTYQWRIPGRQTHCDIYYVGIYVCYYSRLTFFFSWFRNRDTVPSPLSICHLAELDNDTLYLYGPGSLDALDRNWGNQAVQAVSAISFKFIDFDNIVPQLYKIRARFPSLLVSIPRKKHD